MTEPRWLTRGIIVALHEESLAAYGGAPGIRDEGLLESALARPRQIHTDEPSADLNQRARFAIAENKQPTMSRAEEGHSEGISRPHPRGARNPRSRIVLGHLAVLAAAYGAGIVRNHPFVDGNKRGGLLAIAVFLHINEAPFDPDEVQEVQVVLGLAAGDLDEAQLAAWVRRQLER